MWYQKTTEFVDLEVRPIYQRSDSSPRESLYVWTYDVEITNNNKESIQLLNRYWQITDGDDQVQEVHGPGVVGERPIIEPGDTYSYTSFTHLPTPFGKMVGYYEMITANGMNFRAQIPEFHLRLPVQLVPSPEPTLNA